MSGSQSWRLRIEDGIVAWRQRNLCALTILDAWQDDLSKSAILVLQRPTPNSFEYHTALWGSTINVAALERWTTERLVWLGASSPDSVLSKLSPELLRHICHCLFGNEHNPQCRTVEEGPGVTWPRQVALSDLAVPGGRWISAETPSLVLIKIVGEHRVRALLVVLDSHRLKSKIDWKFAGITDELLFALSQQFNLPKQGGGIWPADESFMWFQPTCSAKVVHPELTDLAVPIVEDVEELSMYFCGLATASDSNSVSVARSLLGKVSVS
mmetsp:Transcript_75503/g.125897  ORF Transcript_75503/g.125897 Transcript_75503/m.125897 type:complete len:269 (+) Transcript_75503:287-1093(+)